MTTDTDRLPIGSVVREGESPAGGSGYVRRYVGARVTVHYTYGGGYTDTGQVTYIDSNWLELLKDNRERLLVPIHAIRIIKILEAGKLEGDAEMLLRASDERKQIRDE